MEKTFEKLNNDDYLKFYKSLHDARIENKHGCFVSLDKPEAYFYQTNFLLDDGVAGFSLADGDLVAVHKNPVLANQKGYKSVANTLLLTALENGAITLDCYGDFLANMYMQYGFIPTGKMKFNIEYNPEWNVDLYGEPDVIALCRAVKNTSELNALKRNNKLLKYSQIKDALPEYDDYFKLLDDRNKFFEQIHKNNMSYSQACNLLEEQTLEL